MEIQNYCMVSEQNLVCENIVVWDGNPESWSPPAGYLMLPQATTPAKNWEFDTEANQWVLSVSGEGQIGFTWDGTYLTTDQAQPEPDPLAPITGTQTL